MSNSVALCKDQDCSPNPHSGHALADMLEVEELLMLAAPTRLISAGLFHSRIASAARWSCAPSRNLLKLVGGGERAQVDVEGKRDERIELMLLDWASFASSRVTPSSNSATSSAKMWSAQAWVIVMPCLSVRRPGSQRVWPTPDCPDADAVLVGLEPTAFALHQKPPALFGHLHGPLKSLGG